MTAFLPNEALQDYQRITFRVEPALRLRSRADAADFVRARGFVFFWPITGIRLPSLWAAAAGDRPVADAHDDPGHITWGWKDEALGGRDWYYGKVLRKKSTLIAFDLLPNFYALSENYGSYEDDYLTLYEQGRLTVEARQIYEALLNNGRMDTVELRKATQMSSPGSDSRFDKALTDLQTDFKIVPVAVTQSGAWHYAHAYDIVARYFPEIPEQAHAISEHQARTTLGEVYLRSLGAMQARDLSRLFGWSRADCERVVEQLAHLGLGRLNVRISDAPGEWLVLTELMEI